MKIGERLKANLAALAVCAGLFCVYGYSISTSNVGDIHDSVAGAASPLQADLNSNGNDFICDGVAGTNSGLYCDTDDQPYIKSGAVEAMRFTEAGSAVTITFPNGYERHIGFDVHAAEFGPTAPTEHDIGKWQNLKGFDADGELLYLNAQVPTDWDGVTDMTLEVWWTTTGTQIADTEKVQWDVAWNSVAEGEVLTAGGTGTGSTVYTQSGAFTDDTLISTDITIDITNIAVDDSIVFEFNRNVTAEAGDSYGQEAIVVRYDLVYNSTKMPEH